MNPAWRVLGACIEGEPMIVSGVDLWRHEWKPVKTPPVRLPHPSYPSELHDYNVFQIQTDQQTITFAADELSVNVWGFYLPVIQQSATQS